jgi:hypothetical protein
MRPTIARSRNASSTESSPAERMLGDKAWDSKTCVTNGISAEPNLSFRTAVTASASSASPSASTGCVGVLRDRVQQVKGLQTHRSGLRHARPKLLGLCLVAAFVWWIYECGPGVSHAFWRHSGGHRRWRARNPHSRPWLWVPGSPLCGAPERLLTRSANGNRPGALLLHRSATRDAASSSIPPAVVVAVRSYAGRMQARTYLPFRIR